MVYQFGPFRLDSVKRRLWRGNEVVPVTPKAIDTLVVLVAAAGAVVEKDDVLKAVWPDTFVEEATLAQNISTLRKALGETSETPTYIATVPRRGYRFVSAVSVVDELPRVDSPLKQSARSIARLSGRAWMGAAIAAALLLMSGAAGFYLARSTSQGPASVAFTIPPPDGGRFSTSGGFMALSPDGRHVAFVASDRDPKDALWIRSLASTAPRTIAGTEGATQPFWSPDSRYVAFFSDGKLKKTDIATDEIQTICSIPVGSQPFAGTWNRSDDILFWSLRDGIVRVGAAGGTPIRVVAGDSQDEYVGWPQFLQDERRFLYVVTSSTRPDRTGIYVAALASSERSRVSSTRSYATYARPGYLLFVENGTLVAQPFDERTAKLTGEPIPIAERVAFNSGSARATFSVSQNGVLAYRSVGDTQLEWFDRSGNGLGALGPPGGYLQFSIAPDNTRVAAARIDPVRGTSDIWILGDPGGGERRLTFDPGWETLPLWSPDQTSIVFSSNRTGKWEIYRKAATGAGTDEPLVRADASVRADDWLPDGRVLAQRAEKTRNNTFLLIPASNTDQSTALPRIEVVQNGGTISPDGKWLAYEGYEAGMAIFVRPVQSADARWQVSGPGGIEPRWRGDGRELFFLSPNLSIMSVDVESGPVFRATVPRMLFQSRAIAPSGVAGRGFDVTSDGQRFLVNVPASSPPITVVANWLARLQNRR